MVLKTATVAPLPNIHSWILWKKLPIRSGWGIRRDGIQRTEFATDESLDIAAPATWLAGLLQPECWRT